ncbi:hypothetical protein ACQ86N_25075 [Puia sp. P3]|uniref:hypothetical protein n=1 Tax=Puia sp. P3 TaxID=3423952 RepID=UPI003D67F92C
MNSFYALLTFALSLHNPNPNWEKQQDHINGRIARATLDKMRSTTESLAGFLQDSALSFEQYSPVWHGEYFPEKSGVASTTRFGLSCSFYGTDGRNKADLLIMANDISPMLGTTVVNNKKFSNIRLSTNEPTRFWLVTADNDHLPYTPISRKEYLQEAIAELTATKEDLVSRLKTQIPIRSAAIQEAEKANAINEINNTWTGTDREVRTRIFLKNYRSDEDFLKNSIQKHTAGLDSTLLLMQSLLRRPAAELTKAAIITGEAAGFRGFEDGTADAAMLVRPNPDFIDHSLSSEKPQFFLVCWRYNPEETGAPQLDQQFTQQLDVNKLRDFLGR